MLLERHLRNPICLAVRSRRKRNQVSRVLVLEGLAISVTEEEVLRILVIFLHMEFPVELRRIAVLRLKDIELGNEEGWEEARWA